MKKSILALMTLVIALVCGASANAQSNREFIRNNIQQHGCRNVAITKTHGDVMLYDKNGCARSGCPASLNKAIDKLNAEGKFIDDIVLTEKGSWLILYGNNGFLYNNAPKGLVEKLKEYNKDKRVVLTATFNDKGEWAIVATDRFVASSDKINNWLKEGQSNYGQLWTVCLTDDCMVAVYKRGYKYDGDVPQDLKDKLRETTMDVYRLKVAGKSWFIADLNGTYAYNL